jgi:quercetin dioxygenase-like cupin family protein
MQGVKVGAVVLAAAFLCGRSASAQAVGGSDRARPVQGDPGISSMVVVDAPQFRVLRDYAEPGATRRLHSHDDAAFHVFVLVTGQLLLTIEGENPVEVTQGQVLSLKGGAKHTFKNTGAATATIVEVFGKAAPAAAEDAAGRAAGRDVALALTLAAALGVPPPRP